MIESGIVFSGVEHDGDIQQSDEEVERVKAIYDEMLGRAYTAKDGTTKPLDLQDFLFIAPYNAQVRALKAVLPKGARVGSVDKFQGQEAAVCILSHVLQLRRIRLTRFAFHPRSIPDQRRDLARQMPGYCRRRSAHR